MTKEEYLNTNAHLEALLFEAKEGNKKLNRQLAANSADAARYRWLRNGGNDEIGVGIYDSTIGDFIFTVLYDDLDAEIDKELGK